MWHNPIVEARVIQLRRPPVLVAVEGRFVPSAVSLDEIDARWKALCAQNPRYFDGTMLQVLGTSRNGHGGVQIHVQECAYRFYAVQLTGLDLGVRPLGVKAVATSGGRVLVGRRSSKVAYEPGAWEFVPGGSVEPGATPAEEIVRELREEAGLEAAEPPVAVALLYDPHAFTWEVVHRLAISSSAVPELGWEYDEFRMVSLAELLDAMPEPLAPVAKQMLPIAARLLAGAQPGE